MSDATAVVLCGGRSSRFRSDKTRALIDGTTVLDHLLDGLPTTWPVVAVGERRRTSRDVTWARESPAFAGPLAALEAALPLVGSRAFVLLAGDMPYAGRAAARLAATLQHTTTDAAVAVDPGGRRQPLLAAYRTDVVRTVLPQPTTNAPMRRLLDALVIADLPLDSATTTDVDTPDDLRHLDGR